MKTIRLASVAVIVGGTCASAAVIRVPEDVPSVLVAVDQAAQGDSVLVGPGTWTDYATRAVPMGSSITPVTSNAFVRRGITIVGVAGPEATILVGSDAPATIHNVITLPNGTSGPVVLEGLTLTGPVGGVHAILGQTVTVRNCRFVGNGVAIRLLETDLTVEDTLFQQNRGTTGLASGIHITTGSLHAERCEFVANENKKCIDVGSIYLLPHSVVVRDCVFRDNRSAGVRFEEMQSVLIERNLFLRNTSLTGFGSVEANDSPGTIRFNTFAFDSVLGLGSGAGVTVWGEPLGGSPVDIYQNTFYRCHHPVADGGGAAVAAASAVPFRFFNNLVASCTGPSVMWSRQGFYLPMDGCNVFWNNEGFPFPTWPLAPTDVVVDPRLCDPENLDFRLQSTSPCAAENSSCGQIGAFGVGCGTVGVEPSTWAKIKAGFRQGDAP